MSAHAKEAPALQEAGKKYEYYAFISYKHLDKTWARWTQKQLEHYRLPNRLCRQRKTPKHVSPVFRDETDLTGGKTVYALLDEKIRQSKYLIVICSKNMQVNPQYIDYEIETFLAAGNPASRILPLIVDGQANAADPAEECLPPSLKRMAKNMPLGITVNHKKRKEAILKLVACILELDLQVLRSHNQERNQRRIMAALGGGMAFSLALGAFMAWEMLSVKQASLREQLTYAGDTFRQGDRLTAGASAGEVTDEYIPLMESDIREAADRLSVLTAIHPKYQPLTLLCNATGDSRMMFDSTGKHVLVVTNNTVRKYDMQGREVMAFDISQTAQQIVDVSADGVHAVVLSIYQYQLAGTHLWLWNMEEDRLVCHLVGSEEYGTENERIGNLGTVVAAMFSPDGKTVCAYCPKDGGYGNINSELAAWNVQTGEKLFSFSPELLGKDKLVHAFEFIGNTTLHWEGDNNHIYYTLGDAEPMVLSERAMPAVRERNTIETSGGRLELVGRKRYSLTADQQGSMYQIKELATSNTLSIQVDNGQCYFDDEIASRYLLFLIGQRQEDGTFCQEELRLIDLQTMQEMDYARDFSQVIRGIYLEDYQKTEDRSVIYLSGDNGSLYRFDLTTGAYVEAPGAAEYQLIGKTNAMDVLAAAGDGLMHIMEIEGQTIRRYAIEADYAEFRDTAEFSPDGAYLAARHNGGYYLYPLRHPGQQLDAGMASSGENCYACSPDGKLVLKGNGNALALWREDELLFHTQLEKSICSVGVANGRILALTSDALMLYDEAGKLLGSLKTEGDDRFFAAKITADSKRIALVKGSASVFADNVYELLLLDGETLARVAIVTDKMHKSPSSAFSCVYDLSPDGKWLSAILRIKPDEDDQYQISAAVWDTSAGRMQAMTETPYAETVPEFSMFNYSNGVSSAYRLQYVKFAANGRLLSGLQYGSWVFDVENVKTVTYVQEGSRADALPDMLSDGQLLYPDEGIHVWEASAGTLKTVLAHQVNASKQNAMLKPENQHRLYTSSDQQWTAITGEYGTWLYNTQDWKSNTMLAAQPAQVLHLDQHTLIYVTADGLWRLVY